MLRTLSFSGIRPPADPKGPPFVLLSDLQFWLTDPKVLLKAPSAPIFVNFVGEARAEKTHFCGQMFQKFPKIHSDLWKLGKSVLFRPKKQLIKFRKFFKIRTTPPPPPPPPRMKILDPPLIACFHWIKYSPVCFIRAFSINFYAALNSQSHYYCQII